MWDEAPPVVRSLEWFSCMIYPLEKAICIYYTYFSSRGPAIVAAMLLGQ
jgi:hypothetical protein